jgi:hypothetical protein
MGVPGPLCRYRQWQIGQRQDLGHNDEECECVYIDSWSSPRNDNNTYVHEMHALAT